jgi:hypothetical protein
MLMNQEVVAWMQLIGGDSEAESKKITSASKSSG